MMEILSYLLSNPITAGIMILAFMYFLLRISGVWRIIIESIIREEKDI